MTIFSISSWWGSLMVMDKIYWTIAIPFTIIFIIQLILSFIGGGTDSDMSGGDTDTTIDNDHEGGGFHFFTLQNMVAFFTIFAWSGLASINAGLSNALTIIISVCCGGVMMLIMSTIFYFMSKMTESGTMNVKNALGKTATVYLTIPAKGKGNGKVLVKIQNTLRELNAITDESCEIKTSSIVEVIDTLGNNVLKVKLK